MILIIEPLSLSLLESGLEYRPKFARISNAFDMAIELENLRDAVSTKKFKRTLIKNLITLTSITISKNHGCYVNTRAELFK